MWINIISICHRNTHQTLNFVACSKSEPWQMCVRVHQSHICYDWSHRYNCKLSSYLALVIFFGGGGGGGRTSTCIWLLYHLSLMEWRRKLKSFVTRGKALSILHSQRNDCWCLDDERSQDISSYWFYLVKFHPQHERLDHALCNFSFQKS